MSWARNAVCFWFASNSLRLRFKALFFYKTTRVTQSRTLSLPFLVTLDRIQGKERSRIQAEGSLPCPQEPAAFPYPKVAELNILMPYLSMIYFNFIHQSQFTIPTMLVCIVKS
jgi:hypothetical protein